MIKMWGLMKVPCTKKRRNKLSFGTPIKLKLPYIDGNHDQRTLGRIAYYVGENGIGHDLYAIFFEGYCNSGKEATLVDFLRREFVVMEPAVGFRPVLSKKVKSQ